MKKASLMIIAAAVCWGAIPIFYHSMSANGLTRMQTITVRFTLSALGYVCYLLVRDPSKLRIKRPAHLLYFVGTGVCSLAFFNFCYITCIGRAGVACAALLLYTAPVFVLVMSALLFHERITARGLAALLLTVVGCAGVAGVFSGGAALAPSALLWGLGAGFGYALYSIFGKYALRHYCPETITAYTAVFAAAATLPLAEPAKLMRLAGQPAVLASGLGCALLCTVLAYLLYTAGLSGVPAGRAAVLSTAEPVVATVLGAVLLGERVTWDKLLGIVLVLGAIVVLSVQRPAGKTARQARE